jgi:hypothetical protein
VSPGPRPAWVRGARWWWPAVWVGSGLQARRRCAGLLARPYGRCRTFRTGSWIGRVRACRTAGRAGRGARPPACPAGRGGTHVGGGGLQPCPSVGSPCRFPSCPAQHPSSTRHTFCNPPLLRPGTATSHLLELQQVLVARGGLRHAGHPHRLGGGGAQVVPRLQRRTQAGEADAADQEGRQRVAQGAGQAGGPVVQSGLGGTSARLNALAPAGRLALTSTAVSGPSSSATPPGPPCQCQQAHSTTSLARAHACPHVHTGPARPGPARAVLTGGTRCHSLSA